jgi:glycosyltransferase involved in cell wall biosynthesis
VYPTAYVNEPGAWSREEAYAQMDGFTYEEFTPEALTFAIVLLPPLRVDGVWMKGLLFAPGVDAITSLVPLLSENFLTIANSRWASYPWSRRADAYFVSYENPHRERYFRRARPERDRTVLIPRQTADYVSERQFCPRPDVAKDIDVLVVARVHHGKNLPRLAEALAILSRLNETSRLRVTWAMDNSLASARRCAGKILSAMERSIGPLEHFLDPVHASGGDMPSLYARSKVFVLPSLVEGKSRALSEAMCADVPVVLFDEFNRAARGDERALPDGAGLAVESDAESLARGLAAVIAHHGDFRPRAAYLATGGRKNLLMDCVRRIPYFADRMPSTEDERALWLSSALRSSYGLTLDEFLLFGHWKHPWVERNGLRSLNHAEGAPNIKRLLEMYAREIGGAPRTSTRDASTPDRVWPAGGTGRGSRSEQ